MIQELAGMAELVDAQDLKSCAEQSACRFDPGSRQESLSGNREAFFYTTVIPNLGAARFSESPSSYAAKVHNLTKEILKQVQNDRYCMEDI